MEPDLSRIVAAIDDPSTAIVLIDGGSGSGKTELARRLAPVVDAELVSMDDIYPGWEGLEAASHAVLIDVLGARRWQRWDWAANRPAEWHDIEPGRALVIEGCGALSRENRSLATLGVWIELDEPTRKARALARDGETYAPHWDRWAAQERAFFDRERPDLLADIVLRG